MKTLKYIYGMICILLLMSCQSEYQQTVNKELSSGEINEELFLGMRMGQTKKDFFDTCWQLNKEQKVSQGPGNKYARHIWDLDSKAENSQKVDVLFYGIFDDQDIMHGMELKMTYTSWSPWNKDYHAPELMNNLKRKFVAEYGDNPFIQIKINKAINAFVKVDGNRQILMYPMDNQHVMTKITDLRHPVKEEETKEI